VKAFLAQAKEEFNKKWDEAAQVRINISAVLRMPLIFMLCCNDVFVFVT